MVGSESSSELGGAHAFVSDMSLYRSLAYAEMRLILARFIFTFDMQLADEEDDWMDQEIYLLWKKRPLNVYLTPVR